MHLPVAIVAAGLLVLVAARCQKLLAKLPAVKILGQVCTHLGAVAPDCCWMATDLPPHPPTAHHGSTVRFEDALR